MRAPLTPLACVWSHAHARCVGLHRLFLALDTHSTGALSKPELRVGIRELDPSLSSEGIDAFIEVLDRNGNGRVNFDELFAALSGHHLSWNLRT